MLSKRLKLNIYNQRRSNMKLTTEQKQQIIDNAEVVRIGNLGQWSDDELKSELQVRNGDEWRNGDACVYKGCLGDKTLTFIGDAIGLDFNNDCVVLFNGSAAPAIKSELSKPETAKQKEIREREENARELYALVSDKNKASFEWSAHCESIINDLTDANVQLPGTANEQ